MEEMKILGRENGNLKIALSGEVDSGNADAFYEGVLAAYAAGAANIVFDCAELDFIDSTTLGTFVKILKRVKTDGFKMSLINLKPKIKKLFLICSLTTAEPWMGGGKVAMNKIRGLCCIQLLINNIHYPTPNAFRDRMI